MKKFCLVFLLTLMGCQKDNPSESRPLVIDAPLRASAESMFESNLLLASLERIKAFHQENSTGMILNAPAAQVEIDTAEAAFGCRIPLELEEVWRWHNGESTKKFIWYHQFLSTAEAVREYQVLTAAPHATWKKEWIPVFEFEGEWYGVECSANQTIASPVIFYFVESGETIAYANLTRYMQVMADAVNTGVLGWSDGWWQDNVHDMAETHALYNSGIPFPYYVGK